MNPKLKNLILFLIILSAILIFIFQQQGQTNKNKNEIEIQKPIISKNEAEKENNSTNLNPINSNQNNLISTTDKANNYWQKINLPLVEAACLSATKQEAGEFSFGVKSCTCKPFEKPDEKNFDCEITAIDGLHELTISCYKSQELCEVTYGENVYAFSFEELEELINLPSQAS